MAYTTNMEYIIKYPGVETRDSGVVDMCSVRELVELFYTPVDRMTAAYNRDRWIDERVKRDKLLAECDWTQAADTALSDAKKAEWTTYRQALRDIGGQADVDNITWPTAP